MLSATGKLTVTRLPAVAPGAIVAVPMTGGRAGVVDVSVSVLLAGTGSAAW